MAISLKTRGAAGKCGFFTAFPPPPTPPPSPFARAAAKKTGRLFLRVSTQLSIDYQNVPRRNPSLDADYGLIAGEADVNKGPREDDADDDEHDPGPTSSERSVDASHDQNGKTKKNVKKI